MPRPTVVLVALVLAALPLAAQAYPVQCGWTATLIDIAAQPPDAPILIDASPGMSIEACPANLGEATVTVHDAASALVAGSLSYDTELRALLWLPTSPLAADADYSVQVLLENPSTYPPTVEGSFAVHTLPGGLAASTGAVTATLTEYELRNYESCPATDCPDGSGSMTQPCTHSWTESYDYGSQVTLQWDLGSEPAAPWLWCDAVLTAAGAPATRRRVACDGVIATSVTMAEPSWPLCIHLELVGIATDRFIGQSEEHCFEAADLVPIEHSTLALVDFSRCEDPSAYENHPLNKNLSVDGPMGGGSSGCSLGGRGASQAPWLVLVAAAGLLLWRRRR